VEVMNVGSKVGKGVVAELGSDVVTVVGTEVGNEVLGDGVGS